MEAFDDIGKELQDIAPTLSKMSRTTSFSVEEGYFDKLPTQVMNRIHAGKRKFKIDLFWLLQPKWSISVSFAMVVLVTGSFILYNHTQRLDKPMAAARVQQLLIEPATMDNIVDDVDVEAITDALAENIKAHKKARPAIKHADKKALEEYILDNMDANSIIDEL